MGTEAFGYMLTNFIRNSTLVSTEFMSDRWADSWIIVYMGAFFAYGPPIGLYLARLGKGRTVRQFLLMNVFAPSMFVYLWINTFGSLAIYYQWKNLVDVWSFVQTQGLESTVIGILQLLPIQHGPHCFLCHCDYDFLCHTGRSHDFRVGDHFHQRYFR